MSKLPTFLLITLITASVSAVSIPINNADFETDAIADNSFQSKIPDLWSWTPLLQEGGAAASNVMDKAAFSAQGINGAYKGDQYFLGHAVSGAQTSIVFTGSETALSWESLAAGDRLTISAWATYPNHVDGSPHTGFWLNYPVGQSVGVDSINRGPGWFNVSSTGSTAPGDWTQLVWTYEVTQADIDAAIAGSWGNVSIHLGFLGNANADTQVAFDDITLDYTTSRGPKVKVILVGGQSNAYGLPKIAGLPANLQVPQQDVPFYEYEFGGTPKLKNLQPRQADHPSGYEGFGPELTFGRTVADTYPGETYAIIKYTYGATNLYSDWNPVNGPHYISFQNTIAEGMDALRAAGYYPEIVAMIWHQGESDALELQEATYETNLTNFIADVRGRYNPNLLFLIGEVLFFQPNFATIIAAQQAVAAADPFAKFVPAADLSTPADDLLHFDTAGMIDLGNRYASAYLDFLAEDPVGDPDADGISNLLETALGGNPHSSDANDILPTAARNANAIEFTFRRADPTLTYTVQTSPDLLVWTDFINAPVTVTQSFETYSIQNNGRVFVRLHVSD